MSAKIGILYENISKVSAIFVNNFEWQIQCEEIHILAAL